MFAMGGTSFVPRESVTRSNSSTGDGIQFSRQFSRIPRKQGVRLVTSVPTSDGPLAPEHHRELALAGQRAKKIRRAAGVAALNGWITAVLAFCSAPFALFGMTGALVTLGLSAVAYNEFRGRKRLLQFDPSGASVLGWNQVGLLAMIVLYCLWMIYAGLNGMNSLSSELRAQPELAHALGSIDVEQLYKSLVLAIYGIVLALSVVFQGLNAFYYFTRRGHVEAYLRETPQWVLDLQRATDAA